MDTTNKNIEDQNLMKVHKNPQKTEIHIQLYKK